MNGTGSAPCACAGLSICCACQSENEDTTVSMVTIGPGLLPELLTPMPQAEYDALPVPSAEDWREAWARVRADLRMVRR